MEYPHYYDPCSDSIDVPGCIDHFYQPSVGAQLALPTHTTAADVFAEFYTHPA